MSIILQSHSPNQRRRGNPKPRESLSTAELWQRLLRLAPELAIVELILSSARPPLNLAAFHANLQVWRRVISGLNLPCFAPGSPLAGRTQRAIEWLLLDSAKPMGVAK
jgi:hypothetical protein